MKTSGKRVVSLLLTLAMALSLLPTPALAGAAVAGAPVEVYYLHDGQSGGGSVITLQGCTTVEASKGENTEWLWNASSEGTWLAVTPRAKTAEDMMVDSRETKNITIPDHLLVADGLLNLVLCDGATLTVTGGIEIAAGATLNIYAGSVSGSTVDGTGALYAGYTYTVQGSGEYSPTPTAEANCAGISCNEGATLTIYGGNIHAAGGENAAGIGGGSGEEKSCGTVNIAGGTVTATGDKNGAGIGGGSGANGGTVTVSGGTVIATGGQYGAGIGGGSGANGGTVTISDGTVIATGGQYGAGIGGGNDGDGFVTDGKLEITGGTVTATGGQDGAGIGGGEKGYGANGGTVTISGGTVTATGGPRGAGIGGGDNGPGVGGGKLEITGGNVTATGGENGAGIGGGNGNPGVSDGTLEVSGGTVMALGGKYAAGIGGGNAGDGTAVGTPENPRGTLKVSGGNVTAIGGEHGAGIGGGNTGSGGKLEISDGTVTAIGGEHGAGIGGGYSGAGGTVKISGGSVAARGGTGAGGIGIGYSGTGANVTISGGATTVAAVAGTEGVYGIGYKKNVGDSSNDDLTVNGTYHYYSGDGACNYAPAAQTEYEGPFGGSRLQYMLFVPVEAGQHIHDEITFLPWADPAALPEKGSYYLVGNVCLKGSRSIVSETLNLCLNGNTVFGPAAAAENSGSAFLIGENGTLNLYDDAGKTGAISHLPDEQGRGVTVSGGTFNLVGGSIAGNTLGGTGAGVLVANGTFNQMGGAVTGNRSINGSGAGVSVAAGATFRMTGGSVTGNSILLRGNGGNVPCHGAGVLVEAGGTFTVSGGVRVQGNGMEDSSIGVSVPANVWLGSEAVITLSGALTSAALGVAAADPISAMTSGWGKKAGEVDPKDCFVSDAAGWQFTISGEDDAAEVALERLPVRYVEYTADANGKLTSQVRTTTNYTVVDAINTSDAAALKWSTGDYVLLSDVDTDLDGGSVLITGEETVVNLILCDGKALCANRGVEVTGGATLNIFAGSTTATEETPAADILENAGKLYATAHDAPAVPFHTVTSCGIVVDSGQGNSFQEKERSAAAPGAAASSGTLAIHGGTIEAQGRVGQAGIGGRAGAIGGTVIIYDGTVIAAGGRSHSGKAIGPGAGIGGGGSVGPDGLYGSTYSYGDGGTVTVYGGTVVALGGSGSGEYGPGGAGIGGGGGTTYTNNETAEGLHGSNGGVVTVYGGVVTAVGLNGAAGIGGGAGGTGGLIGGNAGNGGSGGVVTLHGGSVAATSCDSGGDKNAQNTDQLMKGINSSERSREVGQINAPGSKRVGIGGGAGGIHRLKNEPSGGTDTPAIEEGTDGADGPNGTLTVSRNFEVLVKGENEDNEWRTPTAEELAAEFDPQREAHYFKAHGHAWTLSAAGATVTATCANEDCWYKGEPIVVWPDRSASFHWVQKPGWEGSIEDWQAAAVTWHQGQPPITLTLLAPALKTYGSSGSPAATLDETELAAFTAATQVEVLQETIKYEGRGSTTYEESTEPPTNVGTYTAKLTVGDVTASVDYTIQSPYVPTPETSTTVPVSGESDVPIEVTVSGDTAAVSDLTQEQLEAVVAGQEPVDVTFGLGGLGTEITSVSMSTESFKQLAQALAAHEGEDQVTIQTAKGKVTFDEAAVQAIAAGATEGSVTLSFGSGAAQEFNPAQREALAGKDVKGAYSLTLPGSTTAVTGFGDGAATVTLPLIPDEGTEGRFYAVYAVSEDGDLEKMETEYQQGKLHAAATGFSDYVLVYEPRPFTDVKEGSWFFDAVYYCYENGLFAGTTETTFGPKEPMNRAMFTTVLYRLAGEPAVTVGENLPFEDVQPGRYYTKAVVWAAGEGIVAGVTETLFAPKDPVTREQIAAMLWRLAGKPQADETVLERFADGQSISGYARQAVAWAVSTGLMVGKGEGMLDPQAKATRAEVARIVQVYHQSKQGDGVLR